jgi:hypothetical protein
MKCGIAIDSAFSISRSYAVHIVPAAVIGQNLLGCPRASLLGRMPA